MLHIIVLSWYIRRMLIYVFSCFRLLSTRDLFLNLWCRLAYFCLTSTTLTLFPHPSYFINNCSYICTTQKSVLRCKKEKRCFSRDTNIYKGQMKQKYMDRSGTDHTHLESNFPQDARRRLGYCGHQALISHYKILFSLVLLSLILFSYYYPFAMHRMISSRNI